MKKFRLLTDEILKILPVSLSKFLHSMVSFQAIFPFIMKIHVIF
ncbi:hypothetical protein ABEDC_1147 [Acinetobacter lwoffii]|nr:hypothetical protein ABEDC_1147 [Acinetobacter lwoffii]